MTPGSKVGLTLILCIVFLLVVTIFIDSKGGFSMLHEFTSNKNGKRICIDISDVKTIFEQSNIIVDGKTVPGATALTLSNGEVYEVKESYDIVRGIVRH